MQIDKVGYDLDACAAMTEAEFVATHLPNEAIGRRAENRSEYLKMVYAQLVAAAEPPKVKKARAKKVDDVIDDIKGDGLV